MIDSFSVAEPDSVQGGCLMSDGCPPREQCSERPELAVTRASVCVQKIGWSVTCVCVCR